MASSELHIMIKQLINNQGASFIADKRFANILLDMGCFYDCPKCKNVLRTINESDYANRILSYIDGYESVDNVFLPMLDELNNRYNYAKNDISFCIQTLLYGLDILDRVEEYSSQLDYSWLNSLQEHYSVGIVQDEVDEWNTEYAIINVSPADADVYVDGQRIVHDDESVVVELAYGEHKMKIHAPMYFVYEQKFIVEKNKENTFTVNLIPNFASLLIMTNAKEAVVYIDNVEIGKAPISQEKVSVGIHSIKVTAPFYKQHEETISIKANEKLQKMIELEPNYGEAKLLSTDSNVQIYIDGKFYGKGKWQGKLSVGTHIIECKRESHQSKTINVFIRQGEIQNICLPQLEAYYGCLKINVKPVGSTILLDNKLIGKTPLIYRRALVGSHKLKVYSELCDKALEIETKIEEGKILVVEETLPQTFYKDYNKVKIGDYFYADGTFSHEISSMKKVVGIVFTLNTSDKDKRCGRTHGQIIAIENCNSGTNIAGERAINCASTYRITNKTPNLSNWCLPTIQQWNCVFRNLIGIDIHSTLTLDAKNRLKQLLKISNENISNFWTMETDELPEKLCTLHIVPSRNCVDIFTASQVCGIGKVRTVAAF